MAAWIIAALRMLAQGTGLGVGFEVGQRAFGDEGERELAGQGFFPQLGMGRVTDAAGRIINGRGSGVRRRRRRALTASDRADIAFIAGMISKSAAKDFAVQLAARPR